MVKHGEGMDEDPRVCSLPWLGLGKKLSSAQETQPRATGIKQLLPGHTAHSRSHQAFKVLFRVFGEKVLKPSAVKNPICKTESFKKNEFNSGLLH